MEQKEGAIQSVETAWAVTKLALEEHDKSREQV